MGQPSESREEQTWRTQAVLFEYEGTIIEGTTRPEDLIPAFTGALEELDPIAAEGERNHWHNVYEHLEAGDFYDVRPSMMDVAHNLLWGLMEPLDAYAPEGYEFGTPEGDGADFGFWRIPEE